MERISKHISYLEATRSNTADRYGIKNTPNTPQLTNMKKLAENVFEPTREHFGKAIYVSSFFRSKEVNEKIKGSNSSQHLCNNGAAIDMDADVYGGMTNIDIFNYIKHNLDFDQLIVEDVKEGKAEWIHVSYVNKHKNRNQILIMHRQSGKTTYEAYTPERLKELLTN